MPFSFLPFFSISFDSFLFKNKNVDPGENRSREALFLLLDMSF